MKEIPTKNKKKFIMPEIIVLNGKMWAPKVELTAIGNQLILESVISTDEEAE